MRRTQLYPSKPHSNRPRLNHRAVVIPIVAISIVTLIGFAALAIDAGAMYNTRTELQRTADAASLAAVAELGDFSDGQTLARARATAKDYAARNDVLNAPVLLIDSDIEFGHSDLNPTTGKYSFEPTTDYPNAVRVTARRTQGSPSGPMDLYFARIFGIQYANISAKAAAVLTPRDIVFVLDLSGSHKDDSTFTSVRKIDIYNRPVWVSLWDENSAPNPGNVGPSFGNMNNWGAATSGPSWDYANDPGLLNLPRSSGWSLNSARASQTLTSQGYGAYNAAEMTTINSASNDGSTTAYKNRVEVALGLVRWQSGKAGGQAGGNGDNVIDSNELTPLVAYPSSATNPTTHSKQVGGSWSSYLDYVINSNSSMLQYDPSSHEYGIPGLRYRYGLKTFVDYVQISQGGLSRSPGLNGAAEQPMQAVADAVTGSLDIIKTLNGNDLAGLASYGTVGYGPAQQPNYMSWLTDNFGSLQDKVSQLQAGMWTSTTNISQGIDKGVDVLFNSSRSRPNAAKILLVLTDGRANQTRANPTAYFSEWLVNPPPRQDTIQAARDAAAQGVRIYTISVGATSDINLMTTVAQIGKGSSFHAEGTISTYQAQLDSILKSLGALRPVLLIE